MRAVERLRRRVLEQVPVGVDRVLEVDALIGLQIGSPSRLTRTAGVVTENTVGGSALIALGVLDLQRAVGHVRQQPVEVEDAMLAAAAP